MLFRALSTTAICSGRARTTPLIKKFPVTLRLQYPYYDTPTLAVFPSYQKITDYLLMYRHFLIEQLSGRLILPDQVDQIDPDRIYDVGGTGLPFHENGLMREQVWDRVFETKTALALKEALERKDPNVTELPRVIKGKSGKEVGEWDGVQSRTAKVNQVDISGRTKYFDILTSDSNSGCENTSKNTSLKFFPREIGLAKILDYFCHPVRLFSGSQDPLGRFPMPEVTERFIGTCQTL